jgi:hypothetical protein
MNTETQRAILAEVMAEIEKRPKHHFELVYNDYREGFEADSVAALARGDWETLDELHDEWISESQWMGADALLNDIVAGLDDWDDSALQEWLHTEAAQEAYQAIMEKDSSTPLADLARNSGIVLLRIRAQEGDDVIEEPEDEIHYWIAAVNVIDLYELPAEGKVRLSKAYPWRGDVWNGGGMVDDENPVEVIVDRADLRTDKDASGYSWTETAGPLISYYESEITPI